MASVTPTPSLVAGPRRRGYRELLVLVAVQSFGNQMAGSFWLVYLVSTPQSLPFNVAVLMWFFSYLLAAILVVLLAGGRPIRATTAMTVGLAFVAFGHVSFVFFPPMAIVAAAAIGFGVYIPAFWLPMGYLLSKETKEANRAGRMAGVTATFTVVGIVAPVVGGFIAQAFSYPVLFLLGGAVVSLNILFVRLLAQKVESVAYRLNFRRVGVRTSLAFSGQGAVEGVLSAATPLASFLFTKAALELGLLFAFFSMAAGVTTLILGQLSDRVRARTPFLVLGPILSVPAALIATTSPDLGSFALAVGWLSMATSVAPSFIFTILVDRMEDAMPDVSATREFLLNTSRTLALGIGLVVLLLGGGVQILFVLVAGAVLLEILAK